MFVVVILGVIKILTAASSIWDRLFPPKLKWVRVGYPENWNLIRREVLKRDEYKCVLCSGTHSLQVHHIIPISKGGINALSNLETVCRDCHEEIHPHMKVERLEKEARLKANCDQLSAKTDN
jgi:5-methylcytosine-specific restriction endonuclease McrA